MNQRLIIIVSIVLLLLGILGIYFSDSGDSAPTTLEEQSATPHVTYYITKRVMAAGEEVTKNDYEEKTEQIEEGAAAIEPLAMVDGYYLTESVNVGTRLTATLLTKDKPIAPTNNQLFRFTIHLNQKYVNNISRLLPGDGVDIYIKFDSPKRESENKSTIYRGESIVKIVKLFRDKKLLTPVMKWKKTLSDEENSSFSAEKLLDTNVNYVFDIELSRSELKKIYQINNDYEMIVFPTDNSTSDKKSNNILNKGGK